MKDNKEIYSKGQIPILIILGVVVLSMGGFFIKFSRSPLKKEIPSLKTETFSETEEVSVTPSLLPTKTPTKTVTLALPTSTSTPTQTPININLISPKNNDRVYGKITLEADTLGEISKVEFYIGSGVYLGSDNSRPYTYTWEAGQYPVGSYHSFYARAFRRDGHWKDSNAVTVWIEEDPVKVLPSISLVSPKDKDSVSGKVNLVAEASDNRGIKRVEFYIGSGFLLGSVTSPPYSFSWNAGEYPSGSYHSFYARAYDIDGNWKDSNFITLFIK